MPVEGQLETWLFIWLLAAGYVLIRHWRTDWGVGLVFTYVLTLGTLHWFAPALGLLPWYRIPARELTTEGLRQSAIAILAFAAGVEAVSILRGRAEVRLADADARRAALSPQVITIYLVVALLLYGVVSPLAGALPTIGAIASTGSTLLAAAVGLKAWNAWMNGRRGTAWLWVAATAAFPVITVLGQGFLGYGFAATLIVVAFVTSFDRFKWRTLLAGTLLAYLGLTVYVTYMRDRAEIRNVVWGGGTLDDRLARLGETVSNVEWFSLHDQAHLNRVTLRLDQDHLVGAAVVYLEEKNTDYARGATIIDAVLSVIPRAIWPDKPTVGGSGDIVSTYTGIRFAEGTSVGVGQVLELYVNFGTVGVVAGFLALGMMVTYVDRKAASRLVEGNTQGFLLWYLPGLSLLQVGGSFSEVVATAGASYVLAQVLNHLALPARHAAATEGAGKLGDPARGDEVTP